MFYDTDCGGVVHNIAYLRLIEKARTLLAGNMGMRLADMAATAIYPVVVRTEIDYRRPAKLGDTIRISGRLESLERVRFWVAFDLTRHPTGDEVVDAVAAPVRFVTCRQQLALVQMPEGRPVRLPADWPERYRDVVSPGRPS